MSRQILAIDIRRNSIAAILLSTGLKNNTIEACVHVPLLYGAEEENPLQAGLAALLQKLPQGHNALVLGLPADRTIYRSVHVPFKEEKKIRQILPFELEPNLPMPVDDLIIDYQKYAESDNSGLLTTAIDRQHLDDAMAEMAAVHLRPQLVLPGDFPLALMLSIHSDPLDDMAVLLNVGASKTTFFVLASKRIVQVRSLPSDVAADAGVEALALKIRQTLTAFADSRPDGFVPKKLFLSGPALMDEAAGVRLGKALDMQPQMVDLRAIVPKLETASALTDWRPCLYDGALAMALIEAEGRPCPNFHNSGSPLRNYWTTYRPYIRVPAVLLALVLLLSLGGVLFDSHLLQKKVDLIDARIEDIFASTFPQTRRVSGIDALNQMKSEIKKAGSDSIDPGSNDPRVRTIDILHQLSLHIPKDVDVVFSRLVLGNDGLTVSGETSAFNTVDDIKNRLEKSDFFKQVTIASANMDKAGKKVHFRLKIEL